MPKTIKTEYGGYDWMKEQLDALESNDNAIENKLLKSYNSLMYNAIRSILEKRNEVISDNSTLTQRIADKLYDRLTNRLPIIPVTNEDEKWVIDDSFTNSYHIRIFKHKDYPFLKKFIYNGLTIYYDVRSINLNKMFNEDDIYSDAEIYPFHTIIPIIAGNLFTVSFPYYPTDNAIKLRIIPGNNVTRRNDINYPNRFTIVSVDSDTWCVKRFDFDATTGAYIEVTQ